MGYAHYSEKGYRILTPLVSNEGYDFVAEKNGEFIRVNVKKAGLKDKSNPKSLSISSASGGYANSRNKLTADIYLTWIPQNKKFIELPGELLVGGNSKSKIIPKKYLM